MAEIVTIQGKQYPKRNPLGVLGLTLITLGIYGLYWYYKINEEIKSFANDETISPVRSLMAFIFGWIILVPPFIAMYNTAKHVQEMEQRAGVQQQIEPALTVIFMLLISIVNGLYVQEHLNRVWDRAAGQQAPIAPPMPPPPPAIPPG
ncbi:MAG: DUF4234 domain-containing protein [Actinobacteria bacterium]|nr:MAG: DUF4234 domain-containing protein [Actinomycetota bacterium]